MSGSTGSTASTHRQSILVIDDDAQNLALLSEYLRSADLSILVAEDGESGIERARYANPDLILLDVLLPRVDGYEICRRLKADPEIADIPVIFMTALTETEFKVKGFDAGGVDYITKPFRREEVAARVGAHLRLARLARDLREANERLEQRIGERTAALAAANAKLEDDVSRLLAAEEAMSLLLREKDSLLKEVHHRVKNNLQVISSMLDLQAGYLSDPEAIEGLRNCQSRVLSLALVHDGVCRSEDLSRVDIHGYVDELFAGLEGGSGASRGVEFENAVEDVRLPIETSVPLGLALNEILSNSLDHAFPADWNGERRIVARMRREKGCFVLVIADTGVGMPEAFDLDEAQTLGLQLAQAAVGQLHGSIALEPGPGAVFKIEFPA